MASENESDIWNENTQPNNKHSSKLYEIYIKFTLSSIFKKWLKVRKVRLKNDKNG